MAVKGVHGSRSAIVVHFHKTESAGAAGFTIGDYNRGLDSSMACEEVLEIGVSSTPGQVAHVKLFH